MDLSNNIWIGGLPIGRDWTEKETLYNLSSLPSDKKIIIDLADIYSNGKGFEILKIIHNQLPSNVHVSLKFGLESHYKNNRFNVSKKKFEKDELYSKVSKFLENFSAHKIYSIQLHCMPPDIESIYNFRHSFLKLKDQIPTLKLGISNVEVIEANELISQLEHPINSIQLQANLLEQRLIRQFTNNIEEL